LEHVALSGRGLVSVPCDDEIEFFAPGYVVELTVVDMVTGEERRELIVVESGNLRGMKSGCAYDVGPDGRLKETERATG